MRRALIVLLLALAYVPFVATGADPASAAKGGNGNGKGAGQATLPSSIILDQAGALLGLGDAVTFTTTVENFKAGEYPMVHLECRDFSGGVLCGQLDHPDVVFVLGGGSSPWWLVGGDAECSASLLAYGGKTQGGYDTIRPLAGPVSLSASA